MQNNTNTKWSIIGFYTAFITAVCTVHQLNDLPFNFPESRARFLFHITMMNSSCWGKKKRQYLGKQPLDSDCLWGGLMLCSFYY